MKKILLYSILAVSGLFLLGSCGKMLETQPTSQTTGDLLFEDARSAQVAMDGIYSASYRAEFATFNNLQTIGHQSTMVATDLMADDALMTALDFFGFDYRYDYISSASLSEASRSAVIWNMYYTFITNANSIIGQEGEIGGDPDLAKKVVAQAYAMRAWSYTELIQFYQHTYLGSEGKPGVPVYTEPTTASSLGKGRGTVEDVYTQINADLTKAEQLFTELGKVAQSHSSHIDYYVTRGLQARVALLQGRNGDAYQAAVDALSRPGVALLPADKVAGGITNKANVNSLWTMEAKEDQTGVGTLGFLYYPVQTSSYMSWGARGPKCISKWLYDQIPAADARKTWWKDGLQGNGTSGVNVNYISWKKFPTKGGSYDSDMMYMRAEEMLLIAAEAKARQGVYGDAKQALKDLAAVRLTTAPAKADYSDYLDGLSESTSVQTVSTNPVATLMDEIILQRRIELWGEGFRHHDIQRLKIGFDRNYTGSNHKEKILTLEGGTGPQSYNFLFKIPTSEFNGNKALNQVTDQNPPLNQ